MVPVKPVLRIRKSLYRPWSVASLLSSDLSDEALAKSEALAKGDARPKGLVTPEPLP
jgi:hypothetical protein